MSAIPTEKIVIDNTNTVIVSTGTRDKVIVSGSVGPRGTRGINNISDAFDIDKSQLTDNSTLIYNSTTNKWVATSNTTMNKLFTADISQLTDGATLVYDASTDSWVTTNSLQNQILSSGFF